jgi:hypothetical protein
MNNKMWSATQGSLYKMDSSRERGFVALFFILTVASFLTVLVYSLSRSFGYTLIMLDNFKKISHVRSSALYCKYKLLNNTLLDIEYVPVLGVDIPTPYGTVCRYQSFREISPQVNEVVIVGIFINQTPDILSGNKQNSSHRISQGISSASLLPNFTIKYTYSINDGLSDYVQNIEVVQIH